ncbi:hypothetical protein GCM10009789_37690 [Kribbella sancticallisti]|uniref:Uncharacterized protein n=1 Tax=Kribbella sancticallisti TaxID=460087 RepID=A0ABP4PG74_9ACTN
MLQRITLSIGHQCYQKPNGSWASGAQRVAVFEAAVDCFISGPRSSPCARDRSSWTGVAVRKPRAPPAPPRLIFMLTPLSPARGLVDLGVCVPDWDRPRRDRPISVSSAGPATPPTRP